MGWVRTSDVAAWLRRGATRLEFRARTASNPGEKAALDRAANYFFLEADTWDHPYGAIGEPLEGHPALSAVDSPEPETAD